MNTGGIASSRGFRVSLREFLLLFAAFAVGFTALKYANEWCLVGLSAVSMLALMAAAVTALLDRGPRQIFALGFATWMLMYGGVLLAQRRTEAIGDGSHTVNPEMYAERSASLPTTIPLQALYTRINQIWLVDPDTGTRFRLEELPQGTSVRDASLPDDLIARMGTAPLNSSATPPRRVIRSEVTPDARQFMQVGHLLWALLLGYIGGHFAKFVYVRRMREQKSDNHRPLTSPS